MKEYDETTVTRHERARVKFQARFPDLYVWVQWMAMQEKLPATWSLRPYDELPRMAHMVIENECREMIAGLVKI